MRGSYFFPQTKRARVFSLIKFETGIYFILWGLLKKVVIAENLSPVVNAYFADPSPDIIKAWTAIYAYAFQIYCDFSGYCDIAYGCAKILDFEIPLNFRQPYLSTSITEFWHNWHITLSSWFKDYLFIPLGGSRVAAGKHYFNLIATMTIAGLWHGANYTFFIWGLFHGSILVIHKLCRNNIKVKFEIPKFLKVLGTFHLVCLGWIFFRARNVGTAFHVLRSAFDFSGFNVDHFKGSSSLLLFGAPLIILHILERKFDLKNNFIRFPVFIKSVYVLTSVILIVLLGTTGNEFIYFDF